MSIGLKNANDIAHSLLHYGATVASRRFSLSIYLYTPVTLRSSVDSCHTFLWWWQIYYASRKINFLRSFYGGGERALALQQQGPLVLLWITGRPRTPVQRYNRLGNHHQLYILEPRTDPSLREYILLCTLVNDIPPKPFIHRDERSSIFYCFTLSTARARFYFQLHASPPIVYAYLFHCMLPYPVYSFET